jgi:ABC-type lipoprotein release transport system permease subunit
LFSVSPFLLFVFSPFLLFVHQRLYGLSASDPLTFVTAVVGLAIVAALATWLPAYRASSVDPLLALRQE